MALKRGSAGGAEGRSVTLEMPSPVASVLPQANSAGGAGRPLPPAGLHNLAGRVGTPFFVYDRAAIEASVAALRQVLPPASRLCFAIKANPAAGILRLFAQMGVGAEVASAGELALALAAGIPAKDVVFSGPAKTEADHLAAVSAGVAALHVESRQELLALEALCRAIGRRANVALRIALPDQRGARRLGWSAQSPFGMEPDEALAIAETSGEFPHIALIGLHNHAASQVLDATRFAGRLLSFGAFCSAWKARFGLAYVNIGGGFGVPVYADDEPLDLRPIAAALADLSAPGGPLAGLDAGLTAEPGRFLIGPAGTYVTRVVRTRKIGPQRFAFLDGGTHHVHALSGTQRALRRPVAVACLRAPATDLARFELAGPLCTPVDRLASDAPLPADLSPGDLLAFHHVGAYAKHASPLAFLGHDMPAEVLVDGLSETVIAPRQPAIALWQGAEPNQAIPP